VIEQDTIRLLRECDAGITMGVEAIDDVVGKVKEPKLGELLTTCRQQHLELKSQAERLLEEYGDEGKAPNAMVRGMSQAKTGMKLMMDPTDAAIADLMTDGCNMGVKSLNRYLNQYEAAEERVKDITKRLINLEEKLTIDMRGFL